MSFIHLSTVQPTLGQRENTEREPAMFRNDFKNGIEMKKGDQIELVNLRLNFENITITSGINDTLVWQIGPSPAFTQHVVILEEGEYTQDTFVTELQNALNKSIVLESMSPQKGDMNTPITPTLPGGFNVVFSAANTSASPPQPFDTYTISMNQQIGPDNDDTLNTEANRASSATGGRTDWSELGTRVAPVAWSGQGEISNITAGNMIDDDPNKPQPSTLTSQTMEKIVFDQDQEGIRANFNGLYRAGALTEWDFDLLSSVQVLGYEDSIAQAGDTGPTDNGVIPAEITGIFDKRGRTTLRICPILGFSSADFTTAAATFAVQTVLTFATGEVHDGTIALTAGAKYDFSFTITAGSSLINPEDNSLKADGTPRTGVSVIYGKFSDTIQDIVDTNQYNGGLRFAAGKGDDGTGGEPDADPNTDPDSVNLKSELWYTPEDNSFFYYDTREGKFKAMSFVPSFGQYFRVPWNSEGLDDADETTITPQMSAAIVGGVSPSYDVTPTKVLGWPSARLGINRRARVVNGAYNAAQTEDPYQTGVVDARGNHEWAEYWIGISKETGGVSSVAINGTTEPIVQICCPQSIEGRQQYPNPDFLASDVVYENYLKDVTGAATDPTKDIILELKLTDFNHITMSVAQDTSQAFERASTVIPPSYATGIPAQLAPTTGFTLVGDSQSTNLGPGGALPIKVTSYLKELHFPYIPMAQLSRGGHYQAQNTQDQTLMAQRGYAAMYSFDGAIGNGDKSSLRNQRIVREPDISLDRVFPDEVITLDGTDAYELPAFWKFGRLLANSNLVGPEDAATGLPYTEDVIEFWQNYDTPQSAQTIRDFQLEPNISNLDEVLGMRNVVSNIAVKVNSATVSSTKTPNTIPISDVFNVELLSEPVKSHNGATNDIGKSIHTVLANNVKIDADNRSLSYTPPIRLPVDLNVMEDKTVYSLTVAIRDLNNRLIPGLKAPSDVTLYKSESELSKLEKQTELIRAAIIGKNNDRNDVKISNIGRENPLLGVIPK